MTCRSLLVGVFGVFVLVAAPGVTARSSGWRKAPRLPLPRSAHAVVVATGAYVVGGSTVAGDGHAARGSRAVEWFVPPR